MKKLLVLILALPFLAASCNTADLFGFGGGGTRGVFKSEDSGETYGTFSKLDSARGDISNVSINSLVLDPNNPDIGYSGVNGGIYKTENAANSWRYILSGISVAAIAIDRVAPATVYAAGISGQNGKIIKSVDGGTSWVDIYTEPSRNNTVTAIAVLPTSSSTVIAGLLSGEIIRSTDAGRTWQSAHNFSERVISIQFNRQTAYALTTRSGLYKSSDLGVTWTAMTGSLSSISFNSEANSISSVTAFYDLALDPQQTGVVYLGTEQGLFRTVNDGANWSFISFPVRGAGLRVSAVSVNPTNSNNLFASVGSTIYKSVNGGLTWETRTLQTSATPNIIVINPSSANILYLGMTSR